MLTMTRQSTKHVQSYTNDNQAPARLTHKNEQIKGRVGGEIKILTNHQFHNGAKYENEAIT